MKKSISIMLAIVMLLFFSSLPAIAEEDQSAMVSPRGMLVEVRDYYYFVEYADGTSNFYTYYKEITIPTGYTLVEHGATLQSLVKDTWYNGKKADRVTKYVYSYSFRKV